VGLLHADVAELEAVAHALPLLGRLRVAPAEVADGRLGVRNALVAQNALVRTDKLSADLARVNLYGRPRFPRGWAAPPFPFGPPPAWRGPAVDGSPPASVTRINAVIRLARRTPTNRLSVFPIE